MHLHGRLRWCPGRFQGADRPCDHRVSGGISDPYGRTVAQHIGKHLPGHPTVLAVTMPGGGSLKAANYIYNIAPRDGTVFGLVASAMLNEDLLGNRSGF